MKVLLINGSPHADGCTRAALDEVAAELTRCGVESEIMHVGASAISGCTACGGCRKNAHCVIDDGVNMAIDKMRECDGLIVGSPVHYASPAGALVSFLDRMFFAGASEFTHKPGAAVASARRAGTTATLDMLNKYFTISQMPIVSSTYWNIVHGAQSSDVAQDAEGLQTMRNLGRNMAWLLNCIEAGRAAGFPAPVADKSSRTNFIR